MKLICKDHLSSESLSLWFRLFLENKMMLATLSRNLMPFLFSPTEIAKMKPRENREISKNKEVLV